jgi:hypothetical protein
VEVAAVNWYAAAVTLRWRSTRTGSGSGSNAALARDAYRQRHRRFAIDAQR